MEKEANSPGKEIAPGASSTGWGLVYLLLVWFNISPVFMTEQAFRSLLEMSAQILHLFESVMVHSSLGRSLLIDATN